VLWWGLKSITSYKLSRMKKTISDVTIESLKLEVGQKSLIAWKQEGIVDIIRYQMFRDIKFIDIKCFVSSFP
jgi:hypothetical protein